MIEFLMQPVEGHQHKLIYHHINELRASDHTGAALAEVLERLLALAEASLKIEEKGLCAGSGSGS